MKLLLSKRRHPGSALIRAITWSRWSHVDIVVDDDMLLSAAAPYGVEFSMREDRLARASAAVMIELPVPDEPAAIAWAMRQLAKPYDWLGVIGLGLHRNWQDDDAWFCSEFAMQAAQAGGYAPYRQNRVRRLVPEHIWILNLPATKIK